MKSQFQESALVNGAGLTAAFSCRIWGQLETWRKWPPAPCRAEHCPSTSSHQPALLGFFLSLQWSITPSAQHLQAESCRLWTTWTLFCVPTQTSYFAHRAVKKTVEKTYLTSIYERINLCVRSYYILGYHAQSYIGRDMNLDFLLCYWYNKNFNEQNLLFLSANYNRQCLMWNEISFF